MSPFEIVYGFNPLTPLDLSPIPQVEQVNLDGLRKGEFVKKLHQKARDNILKRTEGYKRRADKGRKQLVFEPGEWVWLHMRPERFPQKRSSKLAPRGDGPFKVLERINDNAYRIELPGEFNISSTFNVADLSPYDADDPVLRTKPSEEGGNDEDTDLTTDLTRGPELVPVVNTSPMTRSKTRRLREGFNEAVKTLLNTTDLKDAFSTPRQAADLNSTELTATNQLVGQKNRADTPQSRSDEPKANTNTSVSDLTADFTRRKCKAEQIGSEDAESTARTSVISLDLTSAQTQVSSLLTISMLAGTP